MEANVFKKTHVIARKDILGEDANIVTKCVIPCLNGGKCRGANKCRCNFGFKGNHCEIDNRVSQRSLCKQCRHGLCQSDNTCMCDPGWTGKKCQRKVIFTRSLENT
ncbi:conserved hypothetical protein [Pediculus humanus corporis]|uniref:EGF-like domain-containing protein n=1 Tax=Pediculus humanus subsp. corporis TaxID=121224 RepID=E0VWB7_PEDHC|nr:uncharacterized protein Phum_PHUM477250 [Pediculus humanus corporis]EEB17673.1 conserved hypothetical protein [Pediculus humanus corporis]